MKQFKKKPFKFKIGADPEFNITIQNKKADANFIIKAIFGKDYNRSKNDMGFDLEKAGNIGWDSSADTGEIRPNPSKYPEEVIRNLGKMFSITARKMQLFDFSTLSDKGPVGGHIHFEITQELRNNTNLMRKIHRRMAAFYLPLMMGENLENLKKRHNMGSYGHITDFRVQAPNNNDAYTYEFRVPSAEWITTPQIALSTLAYMATVFHEILHQPKQFLRCKEILFTNDQQAKALQEMTLSNFSFATMAITKQIKKLIKEFEYYPEYKKEIDFILNYNKVLKEKQKAEFNILKGWNMIENKTPTKRALMNDKKIKEISLNKDIENLIEFIRINHSNDSNVAHFANILKQRIIAMNWKLKHTYFFFGLRKGIENFLIATGNMKFLTGTEMIKSLLGAQLAIDLIQRQTDRLRIRMPQNKEEKETKLEKIILFGIPYNERINQNHKKFLDILYQIEKGIIKPSGKLNPNNYPMIENESKEGTFFQIMTLQQIPPNVIRDDDELRYPPLSENNSRIMEENDPSNENFNNEPTPNLPDLNRLPPDNPFNHTNNQNIQKQINKVGRQINKAIKYICAE